MEKNNEGRNLSYTILVSAPIEGSGNQLEYTQQPLTVSFGEVMPHPINTPCVAIDTPYNYVTDCGVVVPVRNLRQLGETLIAMADEIDLFAEPDKFNQFFKPMFEKTGNPGLIELFEAYNRERATETPMQKIPLES